MMIKIIEDKYDGIIIDDVTRVETPDDFHNEIKRLIDSSRNKKLLWAKIPGEKSDFIPVLTKLGFEYHYCEEKSLLLVKKLVQESFIPTTPHYIAGVGAIVLKAGKLLVIKDRFSPGYRLPGGYVEKNESIKDALKREVYEETGVDAEFESITSIGHFRTGQFGESNLYMACTAKALTDEITINDQSEIVDAKWMKIDDFLNSEDVNAYNKSIVAKAVSNKEAQFAEQPVKLRVAASEVFF